MKKLKIEYYYDQDTIHSSKIKIFKYMRLLYRGSSTVYCKKSPLCKVTQQTHREYGENGVGAQHLCQQHIKENTRNLLKTVAVLHV